MAQTSDRWWVWHVAAIVAPLVLGLVAAVNSVEVPPNHALALPAEALSTAALVLGSLALIILAPAVIGSLIGFHTDAQYLRECDAGWAPNPWVWTLLFFVLTPPIASALYLWERNRNVGVNWRIVPILGRVRPS